MPGSEVSGDPVTLDTVREWLLNGRPDAENVVDLRWELLREIEDEGRTVGFYVTHPRLPVRLLVLEGERSGVRFVRLVIETDFETVDLEPRRKLRIYRHLLYLSRMGLVKAYLYGREDKIGLATDLDLRSLSREEFDDALAMLLLLYTYISSMDEFREHLAETEKETLATLVLNYYEKGYTRGQVKELLVGKGLDPEMAEQVLNMVFLLTGRGPPGKAHTLI